MKILHIVEDFSTNSGGVRTVVNKLNFELNNFGFTSIVLSSKCEKNDDTLLVEANTIWLYSKQWHSQLTQIHKTNKISVIHIHGVWMHAQFSSIKFAIHNKIPFIISPHGMFNPWLWKKGALKKYLYLNVLLNKYITKANIVHGITDIEIKAIKNLYPKIKTINIPNLINNFNKPIRAIDYPEKYILFLGRLHKVKGVDLLIEAFSMIENKNYKLKIVGEINNYQKELLKLSNKFNVSNKIEFLGKVTGEEKFKLFKNAFVFVAPSYSEVIGMVNLEAAISKTPVITTFQTGINEDWSKNGGILINPNILELKKALDKVLSYSPIIRNEKGLGLYNYVTENYTWKNKFVNWIDLYKNL